MHTSSISPWHRSSENITDFATLFGGKLQLLQLISSHHSSNRRSILKTCTQTSCSCSEDVHCVKFHILLGKNQSKALPGVLLSPFMTQGLLQTISASSRRDSSTVEMRVVCKKLHISKDLNCNASPLLSNGTSSTFTLPHTSALSRTTLISAKPLRTTC